MWAGVAGCDHQQDGRSSRRFPSRGINETAFRRVWALGVRGPGPGVGGASSGSGSTQLALEARPASSADLARSAATSFSALKWVPTVTSLSNSHADIREEPRLTVAGPLPPPPARPIRRRLLSVDEKPWLAVRAEGGRSVRLARCQSPHAHASAARLRCSCMTNTRPRFSDRA